MKKLSIYTILMYLSLCTSAQQLTKGVFIDTTVGTYIITAYSNYGFADTPTATYNGYPSFEIEFGIDTGFWTNQVGVIPTARGTNLYLRIDSMYNGDSLYIIGEAFIGGATTVLVNPKYCFIHNHDTFSVTGSWYFIYIPNAEVVIKASLHLVGTPTDVGDYYGCNFDVIQDPTWSRNPLYQATSLCQVEAPASIALIKTQSVFIQEYITDMCGRKVDNINLKPGIYVLHGQYGSKLISIYH